MDVRISGQNYKEKKGTYLMAKHLPQREHFLFIIQRYLCGEETYEIAPDIKFLSPDSTYLPM